MLIIVFYGGIEMENLTISSNTKIIIGRESEFLVGEEIKKYSNKILLHYGGGSIKKIGLYEKVVKSLKMNNIEFIELSGVMPNPRVSLVREGIKICKENDISFILAIGGGSVIDSAKAIAIGVNNDEDIWDIFRNGKIKRNIGLFSLLTSRRKRWREQRKEQRKEYSFWTICQRRLLFPMKTFLW